MKKISLGILSLLLLFSCNNKAKEKVGCNSNIQWRNISWNTPPSGLKLVRQIRNEDIYQNDTDKLCVGEIEIDSIRYQYFGRHLQEVNVYYAQELSHKFDSCYGVLITNLANYRGMDFETFCMEIYSLDKRKQKVNINRKLYTECDDLYKKWKEKESKIYQYLKLKYGNDSLENGNGVWENCNISVIEECSESRIRYTNYSVESMQRANLDSLMISNRNHKDSIDKANLNAELSKCPL